MSSKCSRSRAWSRQILYIVLVLDIEWGPTVVPRAKLPYDRVKAVTDRVDGFESPLRIFTGLSRWHSELLNLPDNRPENLFGLLDASFVRLKQRTVVAQLPHPMEPKVNIS